MPHPSLPPLFAPGDTFALFDDSLHGGARLFLDYECSLVCRSPDGIDPVFEQLNAALAQGRFAVVAAHYELGGWLEPKAGGGPQGADAPMEVHLFGRMLSLSGPETERFLAAQLAALPERERICGVADVRATLDEAAFRAAVQRIRRYIAAGDCYQVNFTYALDFRPYGAPLALYERLRRAQPVRHGAFLQTPDRSVLSLSPELFIERNDGRVTARPMKGTAPRGGTPEEDEARRAGLAASEKDRAENLMIVDLVRSDLGRLAEAGSVRVEGLFEIEAYPTVFQMVSTVTASLPHASLAAIFRALFPCGSITGAPKLRAMQIIVELEGAPRGLYTGALGHAEPGGNFFFNVPIRSLVLDTAAGRGRLGVGSGIVYDSDPAAEYAECALKTRFLLDLPAPFELIESLLLDPETGYPLLEGHLRRLARSARGFGFACPVDGIRAALLAHAGQQHAAGPRKARLLLAKDGSFRIDSSPLSGPAPGTLPKVRLATDRVDSRDLFLYHKTTVRQLFDAALADAPDCFDVLFCNERGELTEGARSNLFLEIAGMLYTPPVACGLLDGVMRRHLLEGGGRPVAERVLYPRDLERADAIYVSNAVRGLIRVALAPRKTARRRRGDFIEPGSSGGTLKR